MQINKANALDLFQYHFGSSTSQEMSGRCSWMLTSVLDCLEWQERELKELANTYLKSPQKTSH
jgi:hypothetical protein